MRSSGRGGVDVARRPTHRQPGEAAPMKSAEERMNIVEKYRELGSYRAAGLACGVDHKTVKAVVARAERGEVEVTRAPVAREHNYDAVADVVRAKVDKTRGRDQRQAAVAGGPRGGLWRVGTQLPAAGRRGEGRLSSSRAGLSAVAARRR